MTELATGIVDNEHSQDTHIPQGLPHRLCRMCGATLVSDYGDELCQPCFLASGLETMVELVSSQMQQTLFENLLLLSRQSHQREQTDAAYHALVAAYHAAYTPEQLDTVIVEAQRRADEWQQVLDECGQVRSNDYNLLVTEARLLRQDMATVIPEP